MSSRFTAIEPPSGWLTVTGKRILFKGVHLVDPSENLDAVGDLLIEDGFIQEIGSVTAREGDRIVDGDGWWVLPGLFDMHVHLREPGFEHKETIYSGLRAAAAGGFTGVACMPNTVPPIDNPSIVQFIWERSSGFPVEVHPVAAITKGREGKVLTEMGELVRIGVTAFSDDGSPVASAELMRRALEYSRSLKALIIEHCDIPELSEGGVASEGEVATRLGLPPMAPIAEEIAIFRNVALSRYTDSAIHIAHLSTKEGLQLIDQAKREGVKVSCEVTPHHLTLTCNLLNSYDTNLKVNPPLREMEDCNALIEGLKQGTIDAIATDHAPHALEEKEVEFTAAPFGIVGLETAVGIILTKFVHTEKISWTRVIEALSYMPRLLLKLPPARIVIGSPANLTFIDPYLTWNVDPGEFNSQSRNSPFIGWELKGKAVGVANRGIIWILKR